MTSSTITVNSTWTQIFNIPLAGYYGICLAENLENICSGSIVFMENGNTGGSETTISNCRGINILNTNLVLPMSFHFENYPSRVYEIRKNGNYLEIRWTSGTDISVTFHLLSNRPDKSMALTPRVHTSTDDIFTRLGTYVIPIMKNATASCISWGDVGITSYDVRIYDVTNSLELLNVNLTNNTEAMNNLGSLTNLPSTPIQIEIFVRRNGGTSSFAITLESLTINYN